MMVPSALSSLGGTVMTRRLWIPLLVTLLVAVLVGPSMVAAVEPRATITRVVTIPPGSFHVTDDDTSWDNAGFELSVKGPSTQGWFTAPLFFEAEDVTIKQMTLYAYDNGAGTVCLTMYRVTPSTADEEQMGQACSSGATTGIRTFNATWDRRSIRGAFGPYLWLTLPGVYTSGYGFYGVKITYTYEI
jgi:hypothetical protein